MHLFPGGDYFAKSTQCEYSGCWLHAVKHARCRQFYTIFVLSNFFWFSGYDSTLCTVIRFNNWLITEFVRKGHWRTKRDKQCFSSTSFFYTHQPNYGNDETTLLSIHIPLTDWPVYKDTASHFCFLNAELLGHAFRNRTDLTLSKQILTCSLPFRFFQYFLTPYTWSCKPLV